MSEGKSYTYKFSVKIFAGIYGTKICRKVGRYKGEHPWDGHTYHWGGNHAKDWLWVVMVEDGREGAPL